MSGVDPWFAYWLAVNRTKPRSDFNERVHKMHNQFLQICLLGPSIAVLSLEIFNFGKVRRCSPILKY